MNDQFPLEDDDIESRPTMFFSAVRIPKDYDDDDLVDLQPTIIHPSRRKEPEFSMPQIARDPDPSGFFVAETIVMPALKKDELIQKSIVGAQWIMFAILIGVPLGFGANIIVGRYTGSAGLGYLALMQLVVATIQTFFLFGGSNVIVNFIPRASSREKSAFLFSYVSIAAVFSVLFLTAMIFFPNVLQFLLLNNPVTTTVYIFLGIFIPIVISQTLLIAALQGEMELPASARTQYSVQVMTFVLACVVAFVIKPLNIIPIPPAIAGIVLLAYSVSLLSGLMALIRVMRKRWRWNIRWFLPEKFWGFTTTFHFNTIVAFFYNNVDQIFILYYFRNVEINGIFRAAILVATYALWAPNLFTGAMYPLFINLVERKEIKTLREAYKRYSAITCVVVAMFGLISGLFAAPIIHIFGKSFGAETITLMAIFSFMYVMVASSSFIPTGALITAHEDIWINLILNTVSLIIRFSFFFVLAPQYGVIGVAISDAVSLTFLHVSTLLVASIRYKVSVPINQHLVSIFGMLILGIYYLWRPSNHTLAIAEPIVLTGIYFIILSQLRIIKKSDLSQLTRRLDSLRFLRKFLPRQEIQK